MVKRREPTNAMRQPSLEEIEAFAAGADGAAPGTVLDPNANRNFKAIRVPFNEYEYRKLEEVAKKLGRTKLNVIRWAILKLAEGAQE